MHTTTFSPGSANLHALDVVVGELEGLERQARALDAAQMLALAKAYDLASAEAARVNANSRARTAAESTITSASTPLELAHRSLRAEIASALHLSERVIERQLWRAHLLVTHYPPTLAALADGSVSERHTTVIVDAGQIIGLGDDPDTLERRAAYEQAVLAVAAVETPNRLRPIAKRLAERHAQVGLEDRHAEARTRRCVTLIDCEDGMSDLIAHLPAIEAHAIYDRLTRMSRELEQCTSVENPATGLIDTTGTTTSTGAAPPVRRTRDEIRADLFADILTGAEPEQAVREGAIGLSTIKAQVQLVVTDEALLGPDPAGFAELSGFGPVDLGSARNLASTAPSWNAIRHDPRTGTILSVDRYRPSEQMRRMLAARDEHCRFIGCRTPVNRCDIDHTIDAAKGGPTTTSNLAHLCRAHHTLKHHGGWRVAQREGGVLDWRSPTGRTHRERPPSRVRFEAMKARAPI